MPGTAVTGTVVTGAVGCGGLASTSTRSRYPAFRMADEPDIDVEVAEEDHHPPLDEETLARREAALAHVVQYGDPVLRSKALKIDQFDDRLRNEVARMAQLMDDALGIGLAATQLGVL